jgi:hypothetical protein
MILGSLYGFIREHNKEIILLKNAIHNAEINEFLTELKFLKKDKIPLHDEHAIKKYNKKNHIGVQYEAPIANSHRIFSRNTRATQTTEDIKSTSGDSFRVSRNGKQANEEVKVTKDMKNKVQPKPNLSKAASTSNIKDVKVASTANKHSPKFYERKEVKKSVDIKQNGITSTNNNKELMTKKENRKVKKEGKEVEEAEEVKNNTLKEGKRETSKKEIKKEARKEIKKQVKKVESKDKESKDIAKKEQKKEIRRKTKKEARKEVKKETKKEEKKKVEIETKKELEEYSKKETKDEIKNEVENEAKNEVIDEVTEEIKVTKDEANDIVEGETAEIIRAEDINIKEDTAIKETKEIIKNEVENGDINKIEHEEAIKVEQEEIQSTNNETKNIDEDTNPIITNTEEQVNSISKEIQSPIEQINTEPKNTELNLIESKEQQAEQVEQLEQVEQVEQVEQSKEVQSTIEAENKVDKEAILNEEITTEDGKLQKEIEAELNQLMLEESSPNKEVSTKMITLSADVIQSLKQIVPELNPTYYLSAEMASKLKGATEVSEDTIKDLISILTQKKSEIEEKVQKIESDHPNHADYAAFDKIGRASCRERVWS